MPKMDVRTLLQLAQGAVDVGNVAAACEFYEVALAQNPNDAEVLEAYAEIMVHYVQDRDRALQMLRHAVTVDPDHGYVKFLNLAQLLQGTEALQCYRAAYAIAVRELGRARKKKQQKVLRRAIAAIRCAAAELFLTDLCDDDNAEAECEANIDDANFYCDDSVEVHQLRGSLRLSQRRNDEALVSLRRAVELTHSLGEEYQPTYESKVELGKLLMQVSPADAFRFLLEVLQMDDHNAYVWFLLGEAARLRQRYHDSARLLKRSRMMATMMTAAHPQGGAGSDAVVEIDRAISVLVDEIGGPEAANAIPDMDHPDPIALLLPEDDENDVDGGEEAAEPAWEPVSDDEDEVVNER